MVFLESNGSNPPLFSKVQKLFVRTVSSDEKERHLRLTVDFSKASSKVSGNSLNIQVSDDDDPFFYFSLTLTEEDYRQLKQLQGLLVDFDSFPSQFIRLLQQCDGNSECSSKFLLLLEEEKKKTVGDDGVFNLKIVEMNNFKHLNHLVLSLVPGNDNDVKKLMLVKIKALKEKNEKAEKFISELESQLFSKNKILASKEEELVETIEKWKEERLTFKAESSKELCEETEKLRKAQLDWQLRIQRERNELEDKYQNQLKEKESDLSRMRLENQILQDKRSHADLTISDQARRIESLEKEVANFRGEIISLRKQNSKIDADYHEKDKMVNSLKTRLAVAEQEAKDLSMLVKRQQEMANTSNEQRLKLEEALGEKEKTILRKQSTIQSLSDDLVKANSIIAKIQKDLSVVNQKLKVRTVIALEQEKVVESHQGRIKELEKELSERQKRIELLLESEGKLKQTVDESNVAVKVRDQKIKDQERLIDWLNRRLSDMSKSAPVIAGATSTPFPQMRTSDGASHPPQLHCSTINPVQPETRKSEDGVVSSTPQPPPSVLSTSDPLPQSRKTSLHSKATSRKPSSVKPQGIRRTTLAELQATPLPSSYFLK